MFGLSVGEIAVGVFERVANFLPCNFKRAYCISVAFRVSSDIDVHFFSLFVVVENWKMRAPFVRSSPSRGARFVCGYSVAFSASGASCASFVGEGASVSLAPPIRSASNLAMSALSLAAILIVRSKS